MRRRRTSTSSTPTGTASLASPSPCRRCASPTRPSTRRETIDAAASRQRRQGAVLVAFPELGLSAYTCDDLFHQRALLDAVRGGARPRRRSDAPPAAWSRSSACRCASTTASSTAPPCSAAAAAGRRAEDLPAELRRVLRGAPVQAGDSAVRRAIAPGRRRRAVRRRPALPGRRPAAAEVRTARSARTSGCRSRRRALRRWPAPRCSSIFRRRTSRSASPSTGTGSSACSRRAAWRRTCIRRPASANRPPTSAGTARRSSTRAATCSPNRRASSPARISSAPTSTSSASRASACVRTRTAIRSRSTRPGCGHFAASSSRWRCRRSCLCRCSARSSASRTCPPIRRRSTSAAWRSTTSRSTRCCSGSPPSAARSSSSASRAGSTRRTPSSSAPQRWTVPGCRAATSWPTRCPASRRPRARSSRPSA